MVPIKLHIRIYFLNKNLTANAGFGGFRYASGLQVAPPAKIRVPGLHSLWVQGLSL